MIFIVVYEMLKHRDGNVEERPLAMFRNPDEANVFLDMLACCGRRAYARAI
ncbi:MAG: hypothetical protein PHU53_04675 [Thermoplasmata archaeon]|nr:hypothetical protein [Thermoplasmata archaeon]